MEITSALSDVDLTETSYQAGQRILVRRSAQHRKAHGQFLTPPVIARYMAKQLGSIANGSRLLDPAAGSGTLLCAVVERLVMEGNPLEIWLDGYEIDVHLSRVAQNAVDRAVQQAAQHRMIIHPRIIQGDLILENVSTWQPTLFSDLQGSPRKYDRIIANPPYFKLNREDNRVKASRGILNGHTNIYTMFMALAIKLLSPEGCACFIVPRSLCSGAYFSAFRRDLLSQTTLLNIHLFESRQDAFKTDDVLQENVILTFQRKTEVGEAQPDCLQISTSQDLSDLSNSMPRTVSAKHVIHRRNKAVFLRLPVSELDKQVLDVLDTWPGTLHQHGLEVSTGPVVPFRATEFLLDTCKSDAVPLLWLQHIKPQHVEWPLKNGANSKPQWFRISETSKILTIPTGNYVIIRRFSAKEEARRLVAAPLMAGRFNYPSLGLENHLNYIHRNRRPLDLFEALGLSALYNSALLDRYVRITNGNTQVNAAELQVLPLPPLAVIMEIGAELAKTDEQDLEVLVQNMLKAAKLLPADFPSLPEMRIT